MPFVLRCALALSGVLVSATADAQGFSALVSPPRFEATGRPGSTYRNVVEITNVGAGNASYYFKTADWALDAQGSVVFSEELAAGSCRPWVGLEAPQLSMGANAKRRYRFEVAVPVDAPGGECRFAILVEGDPDTATGDVPMPVSGRIGIIVYLTVGDGAAKLAVTGTEVQTIAGRRLPVLQVQNTGNAHGRMEGLIDGTDASGRRYSFTPSNLPILAGETRTIALVPEADDPAAEAPTIAYPLSLKGRLDWGSQRVDIDTTVLP